MVNYLPAMQETRVRSLGWEGPPGEEMTNLDSILKKRNIILLTKFCIVKTMVFPVTKSFSRVRFFVTTWTVAYQAPLSMGFSLQ